MHNEAEKQFPISIGYMATDMKKSLAFYRDQLGFKIEHCWPDDNNPLHAGLVLDGQSVMLGQAMQPADAEKFCAGDPAAAAFWSAQATTFQKGVRGSGVNVYLMVPDIDAFAAEIQKKGVKVALPPKTQFYGLRTAVIVDPDGYALTFYTPVKMETCQSCDMPLTEAKPGQMYCHYCVDDAGALRPYEQVFEGTARGYFMEHMKMSRGDAEKAAKEHLAKMPAWSARK